MKTGTGQQRTELALVLPTVQDLVDWSRRANRYIDDHNAPPPDAGDPAAREELILAMEELGGLMERYADSLRRFAESGPTGGGASVEVHEARILEFGRPPRGDAPSWRRRSPAGCSSAPIPFPQ